MTAGLPALVHRMYMTFERRVRDGQDPDLTYIALCELIAECGGVMYQELPELTKAYENEKRRRETI